MYPCRMPTLEALYPLADDAQKRDAQGCLDEYLGLVLRMYERIISDPQEYARLRRLLKCTGTLSCTPPGSNPLSALEQDENS